jgi:ATP-binding cassette, subfamily C, bacterial CydC
MSPTRRLLRLLTDHRLWVLAGILLGFIAIGANVALMATSAYLISKAVLVSNVADIALVVTAVRVLAIGRASFRYLERYVTHRVTFDVLADLRVWFFAAIEPLAPAGLATHRRGDLLGRVVADIDTLEDFYVRMVSPPIVAALVTAFTAVILGLFEPVLGIALIAFVTFTGVVLPMIARRLSRTAGQTLIETRAELRASVVDELSGMADLVALDRTSWHRDRTLALGDATDQALTDLARVRAWAGALAVVVGGLAAVTILGIGASLVDSGRMDGVWLAALPLAALASFEAMGPLAQAVAMQDANETAARRLFALTDAAPVVADPPQHVAIDSHAPGTLGIELRAVTFRYGADEPLVLDDCTLDVPAGTSLAILGPSGSGKTTLVNLLARFWDPASGQVCIGGIDVRDARGDDIRSLMTVVEQDVHLFDATVRDNLAVADADVPDERIEAACRLAGIHDTIADLPAGYETWIGEGGLLLSAGERQRLAIARALIKDAPIVVFDEATANLDVETERDLLASLRTHLAGRTVLAITHRDAVAAAMDRTIRLDAGHVVGVTRAAAAAQAAAAADARAALPA